MSIFFTKKIVSVPSTQSGIPCASSLTSMPYCIPHLSLYFGLFMRCLYSSKFPLMSITVSTNSHHNCSRTFLLTSFCGEIFVLEISIHNNNLSWIWDCVGYCCGMTLSSSLFIVLSSDLYSLSKTTFRAGGLFEGLDLFDVTIGASGYATISLLGSFTHGATWLFSLSGSSTLGALCPFRSEEQFEVPTVMSLYLSHTLGQFGVWFVFWGAAMFLNNSYNRCIPCASPECCSATLFIVCNNFSTAATTASLGMNCGILL